MKFFFQTCVSWWFATMVPVHKPLNTLAARENMRKRRIQSTTLFFSLLITLAILIIYSLEMLVPLALLCCGEICCQLLAVWLNRRGHMELACLLFFASEILITFFTAHTLSISDPRFMLWAFSPMIIILGGTAIFLPAWMILCLAVSENLLLFWYFFIVRHNQLIHLVSASELQSWLSFLCVSIYVTALVGIFYTITTQKAVIQADRAIELEQAHQALTNAYTRLEVVHSELENAHTIIRKQALTDGLTGLPNHRAVVEQLGKELERARRYGRPFSLLFFDADRFKHVNDTYGHAAGDTVLRQIGERAASILRGGDTLGRFGGEEFVLLLPEVDAEEARDIAERVRTTIANEPIILTESDSLNATVSIGVATYSSDGYGEQNLLQLADQAMYMAKRLGRNQVRSSSEALQMSADVELMALLQNDAQREIQERDAMMPERIRENYTVKIICSLMTLLERRDHGMSQHAYAVSDLATSVASAMGLEQLQVSRIGMAALLHDIGKIAIPDILLQKGDRLAPHERALLMEHAELGAQILEASPFLHDLMPAVRHHHEYWDGNGYPDQLTQEDIPLAARIIAVAEAYDAMVYDRPYQARRTPEEALQELWRCTGTQFDPEVVRLFSSVLADQNKREITRWQQTISALTL
jgi:diguanylate cyclase (GGDEF)-like protein/putative nucleotidyltransferase with HDIG domain